MVSIKYPAKRFFLRNRINQMFYLLIVLAYNSLLYLPISYFRILVTSADETNNTNSTSATCVFKDNDSMEIMNILDAINRVVAPLLIMIVSSLILFISIMRLQARISENFKSKNSKNFRRQIRFLVSLIFLNFAYIIFSLPLAIIEIYDNSSNYFIFSLYGWFASYACNFYIVLASNSLFRKEFLKMFKKKKLKISLF